MQRRVLAAITAALMVSASGCAEGDPQAAADVRAAKARQAERLKRLENRHVERQRALGSVAQQRANALAELERMERIRGRSKEAIQNARYGSDGTGDPKPWVQSPPGATKAPNSTATTIKQFRAAQSQGRIRLVGAARQTEIDASLIDDRVLRALIALSGRFRFEVNSLRVSHPRSVQDDLGTPTESNHVYGRAADISAVDGVECKRETRRAPYRTLLDNPMPVKAGPCLVLALAATELAGDLRLGESIFYWRVPGPSGVSLPNHDDHVHIGYRNYPGAGGAPAPAPSSVKDPAAPAAAKDQPEREQAIGEQEPVPGGGGVDSGDDLQLPDPGTPKTLGEG